MIKNIQCIKHKHLFVLNLRYSMTEAIKLKTYCIDSDVLIWSNNF